MKYLTATARSAVIVMIDLATHQQDGLVPLSEIGRRVGMSSAHVEKLIGILRSGGMVTAMRGP